MSFPIILCPVDFSASTIPLLGYAAGLARATGAAVELLHVVEGWLGEAAASRPMREAAAQTRLLEIAGHPMLNGLLVHVSVLFGIPEQVIVSHAGNQCVDAIIIGAHGATGLTRFLMGGTAEGVLRAASCPTLLVTLRLDELPAQAA